MVHMVGVSDFEKTGTNPNNGNSVFYVLLECGHGQTVETHMPKPPSRVMCRECLDESDQWRIASKYAEELADARNSQTVTR